MSIEFNREESYDEQMQLNLSIWGRSKVGNISKINVVEWYLRDVG